MSIPQYTNDAVYQELSNLCEAAGWPVIYKKLGSDIYARTREFDIVHMPNDEQFRSNEHAGLVLGHELAHQLLSDFYSDNELHNADNDESLHTMIESQCDIAGIILYKLAEENSCA